MRVDLDVAGESGGRALVATVLLSHSRGRRRPSARFIVDTGSPITIVSEALRQQLQIPKNALNYSDSFDGVGGGKISAAVLRDAEFRFKSDGLTGEVEQDIYVSAGHQENLLGMDFFEDNNLDLHCTSDEENRDDGGLEAYFEG
ncbi:MAG: aspartyl protease family protein [Candidatus Nanohaloarchaea archaeon]